MVHEKFPVEMKSTQSRAQERRGSFGVRRMFATPSIFRDDDKFARPRWKIDRSRENRAEFPGNNKSETCWPVEIYDVGRH